MPKKKKSNKQLIQEARRLLSKKWVKHRWVSIKGVGTWMPGMGMESLRQLVDKAKTGGPNPIEPECQVCAEGAVFLACALDGDKTDDRARRIIAKLDHHVRRGSVFSGSVMSLNDTHGVRRQQIEEVFDRTAASFDD